MDKIIFRFDDVCINSDMELHNKMTDYLFEKFPDCKVMWAISPLVHDECGQRVYPKIFNAFSDIHAFFRPDSCGIPELHPKVKVASHGLIHIDHRLLTKEQQEMSILISCSLLKAKVFVPPFNKYNQHTQDICYENNIELIRFETGWNCMEYNICGGKNIYLHAREFTFESFKKWFES